MSSPFWLLLLAGAVVVAVGACAGQRSSASRGDFKPNQRYVVQHAAAFRMVGKRRLLVAPGKGEDVALASGVQLEVRRVVRDNTLTRGIEYWPEAEILDGAHRGEMVFLSPDSRRLLRDLKR